MTPKFRNESTRVSSDYFRRSALFGSVIAVMKGIRLNVEYPLFSLTPFPSRFLIFLWLAAVKRRNEIVRVPGIM